MKRETITYECDACKSTTARLKNGPPGGGGWRILRLSVSLLGGKFERHAVGHACSVKCADEVAVMMLKRSKARAK